MNPEASHGLPPEITDLLDRTPAVTPADMERLRRAAVELDADPGFQADYWKGHFVSAVLDGMEKRALTQSELARRWGKTRQYLNKILDEDGRVNFTIETMVELAMLVGKRLRLELEDCAEFAFSAQFKRDRGVTPP